MTFDSRLPNPFSQIGRLFRQRLPQALAVSASHAHCFRERRRGTRLFHFRAPQTMNLRTLHVLLIVADAQDEADIRQKLGEARNTSFAVRAVTSLSEALQQIAKIGR